MWKFLPLLVICVFQIGEVPANSNTGTVASASASNFSLASAPQSVNATNSSSELLHRASSDWNETGTLGLNEPSSMLLLSTVTVFSSSLRQPTQPTATFSSPTLQTVNESSPPKTASPGCSDINWEDSARVCSDVDCVQKQMKDVAMMPSCMEERPDNVSFSKMDIPKKIMLLGMSYADVIKKKLDKGEDVNTTVVIMTDDMVMEVGVINGTDEKTVTIPDPTKLTDKWAGMAEKIEMPLKNFKGKTIYVFALMPDLIGDKWLKNDEMDFQDVVDVRKSEMSDLFVDRDKLRTHKNLPKKRINSKLVSVAFQDDRGTEMKGPLTESALLTLQHLHIADHFETNCVYLDGSLWSKDGCDVKETLGSQTTCKIKYLSTFALISKVKEKLDDSARQLVVTVATVMGSFSILSLLICAIVAIVINYHQWDNMRIALNIDVAFLLSQLVFFIGLPTSDNLFFSNPKTCEVVNPFVHFFELAALSWLLMEGLYYYSTLKPLFNEKNTVPIVFYFAVGWGLPVAFASACAGFSYPHFGSPKRSEFCWLFIRGKDAWFFATPVLILVLLNVAVRAFILKEAVYWEDDPDDITLERAKNRLVTSLVIMLSIVLTWLFGILAVNNSEDKTYHYFFIVFYTLQGLLVLLFYCIRNQEMWEHRKQKRDEEDKEKNKTFEFVYHP